MRTIHLLFTCLFTMLSAVSMAQIGINQTTPDASAVLDMVSTTQGVLIPRMTTAQRDAINTGTIAQGNMVYNTDTEAFEFYNGASWISIGNEGTNNTYVGETAGDALLAGQDNVFMGFAAGSANTSGSSNTIFGSSAGDVNVDGSSNVILGQAAAGLATSPEQSVIIGQGAASALTTGEGNVAIGYQAMNAVTTENDNVCIGYISGQDLTAANSVLVGAYSGSELTSGASNIFLGYAAGKQNLSGTSNVAIGFEAGEGSAGASNYSRNTLVGHRAGEDVITNGKDNAFVGFQAGLNNTDGINNVVMGAAAAATMTTEDNVVYIGYQAGNASVTAGSGDNVYIGYQAGRASTTADGNVVIGYEAYEGLGASAPTGIVNMILGKQAGQYLTTGSYNNFIGMLSGQLMQAASYHTGIGYNTLTQNNTAGNCTALGSEALKVATGADNIGIGRAAGDNITSGARNIIIGSGVDAMSATASDQLNIGNTIYGEMATDYIGIGNSDPFCPLDVAGATGTTVARFGDVNGVYIGRDWPGVQFNTYYDGTNNVFGHGSSSEWGASIAMDPGTGEVQYTTTSAAGNAGATATLVTHLNIEPNGEAGFGTVNPTSRIHAIGLTSAPAATFDRITTTGTIVSLQYNGAEQGYIGVNGDGTTINYTPFTGAHYGLAESDIEYGMLVRATNHNQSFHGQEKGEIVYGIAVSALENDSTILGVMNGRLEGGQSPSQDNPHTVAAVGNGTMWVVQTDRNVDVGDYLVSSSVSGHAQLDNSDYERSFIIARAVEAVDWSGVQADQNGQKAAQVSVYFQNFVSDRRRKKALKKSYDELASRVELLEKVLSESNK